MESKIHSVEHSYFEIKKVISGLVARYPFLKVESIGKSVAGRDIPALMIGSGVEYTLFVSGDDPTNRITSLILLCFAEELCDKILNGKDLCGINIRKAMFGRGVIFIPLINPDGLEINMRGECGGGYLGAKLSRICGGDFSKWRSNLRGVEIARNLPFEFEKRREEEKSLHICGPGFEGFSGYKSQSEPETVALTELCRNNNIRQLINLSAFGQTIAYSGAPFVPTHSVKMAEVMAAVSSFKIEPPIAKNKIEINDWFTYEFAKPGLSVRLGNGSAPSVNELHYWYCRIKEMLTLSCLF